jgi:uncharacterized protein YkwD
MHTMNVLGRRGAAVMVALLIALGLSSCAIPATSNAGPSDPTVSAMFQALNADRGRSGLPALSWRANLANTAASWASQMARAGSLYHQNLGSLIRSPEYAGYRAMGENILVGPGNMSGQTMESNWMASAPHRANILSGAYNVVGIGYYRGPDGRLWAVQDFGGV